MGTVYYAITRIVTVNGERIGLIEPAGHAASLAPESEHNRERDKARRVSRRTLAQQPPPAKVAFARNYDCRATPLTLYGWPLRQLCFSNSRLLREAGRMYLRPGDWL
jgi:hypothetical protein